MTDNAVKLSIRSLFLWVVMSITTFSLAILSTLAVYTQIETYRNELESNAIMLAKLVAKSASTYLYDETPERIESALSNLSAAELVLNAHVYKLQSKSAEPQIFASYNREGELLLGGKEGQLAPLFMTPQFADNGQYFELSAKVFDNDANIQLGWIYLRVSSDNFNDLVGESIWLNIAVALLLLAISFYSAVRLQRVVTGPVEDIASFLQRTSRQRDYSARAERSSIRELDILADAVNVMLFRMQEYMQKQRQAEEQHRKLNASLEDMVSHRTTALKDANQELIQTLEKLHQFQRQIVQNEKMASLGDMVAGVAHEVNTPIGLGVTASTMMLDRLEVIQKDFDNKTLKASAMKRFLDESKENLNIIYRNLNRAAELISSFKQVAVDQTSESSRSFCVVQLVNEILLSLQPRLKKLKHNINVNCDPTLNVETKAGPINQILINLIMNSVIHGFESMEEGTIDISAELVSDNKLKLVYTDNGKGIPPEIRKRIFDPFVTTKRGQGGSGLGMHLVYNLVTQALKGSISITSEEGEGVEFVIVFPVVNAKTSE
ncbi:HAMP domain-containing histidine kinase [Alteromonas sp. IB21]|uniref:sensor histidine kinase n=1 Tax=Alteromonas sp. IB21 TaxID=2779369 RepID=UPI0018E8880E|nr:HAMP domain-containing sensor histidine kinase [Alteromonas sp. IB21]MBJ2130522.1 HAMP domain-containing histidine kinase [Alteromonas sp. IB21]